MRISSQFQYQVGSERIGTAQRALFEAQQRVVTGKRVQQMSDDPIVAAQGIDLRRAVAKAQQHQSNIETGRRELGLSEQALAEVTNVLRRANELAVKGSNGLTDQSTRDGLITELDGIQDRLLSLANSQGSKGQYLFAGRANDARPFEVEGDAVVFRGDEGEIGVEVAPGETVSSNVNAKAVFEGAFAALAEMRAALESGDAKRLGDTGLEKVQESIGSVIAMRGEIGASIRNLEETSTQNQRRIDQFNKTISDGEDVDLSEAITEFQAAELAYTAALQVMSRNFGAGLMDFIRS